MMEAGETSSVEILRQYIDQIERYDGAINAVVCRDFERALDTAATRDSERARSQTRGPLHGLPMTVKESFTVAGLPTTWGFPAQAANVADGNAVAVQRLVDAGAVVFGKTNVPDALADLQTFNTVYGRTNNPWDERLTCGGSSGGSAAALAAGFTGLELGTDLAGSLRVPAHFCGVFSHKPSYGLVPQTGHSLAPDPAQTDLTVIGPMARCASDLRLALDSLAGPTSLDSVGWTLTLPEARGIRLSDYRVAVLPSHPACEVDRGIEAAITDLARALGREGAEVDLAVEWPIDLEACCRDYMVMARAVGSRRSPPDLLARWKDEALALEGDDGSYRAAGRRAAALTHHGWLAMHGRRSGYRDAWTRFFRSYDVVLCPVHASPAFPHDTATPREDRTLKVNGRLHDYNQSVFWMAIAGLNYLPSTVRPIGLAEGGAPIGVQVIGPYLEDRTTLRFAELLDQLCPTVTYPFEDQP